MLDFGTFCGAEHFACKMYAKSIKEKETKNKAEYFVVQKCIFAQQNVSKIHSHHDLRFCFAKGLAMVR
ncbi:MAG: hypothetical protein EOP33_08230 [Rickettsiaceae bacterium]|nr:MAG: hypothetical protein EOP33_08230 [Rickettsiaceae bacterium]